jgi:hypothetical protein
MATVAFASSLYRRLSLAKIDAVVSARLGTTQTAGNEQPACFNRQLAMYLAEHVGGWSTTVIGRIFPSFTISCAMPHAANASASALKCPSSGSTPPRIRAPDYKNVR